MSPHYYQCIEVNFVFFYSGNGGYGIDIQVPFPPNPGRYTVLFGFEHNFSN